MGKGLFQKEGGGGERNAHPEVNRGGGIRSSQRKHKHGEMVTRKIMNIWGSDYENKNLGGGSLIKYVGALKDNLQWGLYLI